MIEHPYGVWSLAPPVVAIGLAIATRQIVLSLVVGVFAGALLMAGGNLSVAVWETWETHLWTTLIDPGKLRVFSFTLLMGSLVGVVTRSGGMRGLIGLVTPWARTRRRGQLATYGLGLLVFFDDYANTILIGNTMRPIADRLRISREKLAYLVDSTAAPIAGVALISTWIAVELDYIASGLASIPELESVSPFGLFIETLPYRFYVWGALLFVPLTAIFGREFGPMLGAERRAAGVDAAGGSEDGVDGAEGDESAGQTSAWYHAVIPIGVTLGLVVYFLVRTGADALRASGVDPWGADRSGVAGLRDIIGAADSTVALQYGALVGLLVAVAMAVSARILKWSEAVDAALQGARWVMPAIAILWTASALSRMTTDQAAEGREGVDVENSSEGERAYAFRDNRLYTADYLAQVLAGGADRSVGAEREGDAGPLTPSPSPPQSRGRGEPDLLFEPGLVVDGEGEPESLIGGRSGPGYSARWLPTIVFVISAAVAFSTGTSWGTMGILIPMTFPLARALLMRDGVVMSGSEPLLLASVGGVLAGAIFGDHCSPISDTTVLSSQSSGCDHLAHVWTQMPYALAVGGVSIVLGTIPVGFGVPLAVLLPLQVAAIFVLVRVAGRPVGGE